MYLNSMWSSSLPLPTAPKTSPYSLSLSNCPTDRLERRKPLKNSGYPDIFMARRRKLSPERKEFVNGHLFHPSNLSKGLFFPFAYFCYPE